MVGFRNIAVHDYQELDMEILKSIIENNLEDSFDLVRKILKMDQKILKRKYKKNKKRKNIILKISVKPNQSDTENE